MSMIHGAERFQRRQSGAVREGDAAGLEGDSGRDFHRSLRGGRREVLP